MAGRRNVLDKVGADLSFSVSYTIASELRDSAISAGVPQDELIALVFLLYLLLMYLPGTLSELWMSAGKLRGDGYDVADEQEEKQQKQEVKQDVYRSVWDFAKEMHSMAQRITLSLAVQLVARSVTMREPQWRVRVLTLMSVAIFFLYIEASAGASETSAAGREKHH